MPSPLDPLSQIARRASPNYTVTYLITVVFGFAAACVIAGVVVNGVAQAAMLGCGVLFGAASFGLIGFLVFRKPELLRSEPHLRFLALMAWSQDPSLDEDAVRRREQILPALLTGEVSKTELVNKSRREHDEDE